MRHDYTTLEPQFRGNLHSLLFQSEKLEWRYGLTWYQVAREQCEGIARKTGYSLPQAAGVLAALSPGMPWYRNLSEAEDFIYTHKAQRRKIMQPKFRFGIYGYKNKYKAFQIAEGEEPLSVLGGEKVRAFYQCILHPDNDRAVCVDGHAKCAAYNERKGINTVTVRPVEYEHIANAYRDVATERKILPNQAQAIVWLTWRRKHGVEWLPDERQINLFQDQEVPF